MRTFMVICLAALFCGVWAKKKSDENKVKIAVYYESLCPDSKKFITSQLAPVWKDFRGAVKVKLVPYGKSSHEKVSGKWQFICHHGPDECYGNKVQSCILKDRSLQDTDKMELIICLMGQANPDKSLDTCLVKVNKQAESDKLKRCAAGEQGDNLLASYGDKTDSVFRPLSFVPTIVINEITDIQPRLVGLGAGPNMVGERAGMMMITKGVIVNEKLCTVNRNSIKRFKTKL